MLEIDWGPLIAAIGTIMATGGGLLFWALRKYLSYNMTRIAAADAATRTEISDLRKKATTLENAQDDMIIKHATDRQQWDERRQSLLNEIDQLRKSVNVLETAYKETEQRAMELERRVTHIVAELDEKTKALDAMRDRLHKAEISLAESKAEAEFYRTQNKELFDLLKRYQQVQLSAPGHKDQAA